MRVYLQYLTLLLIGVSGAYLDPQQGHKANYEQSVPSVHTVSPQDDIGVFFYDPKVSSVPRMAKQNTIVGDPFYEEPKLIHQYKPGQILKMREIIPKKLPQHCSRAYQMMVRSTDSLNRPVAIVTSLLVPQNPNPNALMSFQVPTDSPCPSCAPSAGLGDSLIKISAGLSLGWYVVVPDFQGLTAAFGAGKLAGQATLDSAKAALKTKHITGLRSDAKLTLWGYSGGSIASGWAGVLQPTYAPELSKNLIGVALGGWITNYIRTIESTDGTVMSGLVGMALGGLLHQYPQLYSIYQQEVSSKRNFKLIVKKGPRKCLGGGLAIFAKKKFFTGKRPVFKSGKKLFENPVVASILKENMVAANENIGVPQVPLFLHHAIADVVAPVDDTRRAIDNYCRWGIKSFEINMVKSTNHISESTFGAPAALQWMKDRFDGVQPAAGCFHREWWSIKNYVRKSKRDVSDGDSPSDTEERWNDAMEALSNPPDMAEAGLFNREQASHETAYSEVFSKIMPMP